MTMHAILVPTVLDSGRKSEKLDALEESEDSTELEFLPEALRNAPSNSPVIMCFLAFLSVAVELSLCWQCWRLCGSTRRSASPPPCNAGAASVNLTTVGGVDLDATVEAAEACLNTLAGIVSEPVCSASQLLALSETKGQSDGRGQTSEDCMQEKVKVDQESSDEELWVIERLPANDNAASTHADVSVVAPPPEAVATPIAAEVARGGVFGAGVQSPLVVLGAGTGGIAELREALDRGDAKVVWACVKFELGSGALRKQRFLVLHISGSQCSAASRWRASQYTASAQTLFGVSVADTLAVTSRSEVTLESLLPRVSFRDEPAGGDLSTQRFRELYEQQLGDAAQEKHQHHTSRVYSGMCPTEVVSELRRAGAAMNWTLLGLASDVASGGRGHTSRSGGA